MPPLWGGVRTEWSERRLEGGPIGDVRELTLRDRRRTLLAAGLGWTFDGYETYALDPDPGCGAACAPAGVRDPLATGKDWLRVAAVSINDDQLIR